jgi:hypothetical protein
VLDAEVLEREREPGDVATQALELLSLLGPAGHRRVQREAVGATRRRPVAGTGIPSGERTRDTAGVDSTGRLAPGGRS